MNLKDYFGRRVIITSIQINSTGLKKDMDKKIINYIKIREDWKNALSAKSSAISAIENGLFRFGSFLVYWAAENYFLREQIDQLYQQNPNYKYVFYLSVAFGIWGIIDSLLGVIKYFQAIGVSQQLQKQVEKLEKEILCNVI